MKEIGFIELYEIAKSKLNPRKISPLIEAGGVAAAILTESGNVYTGVCIDTASSLGMCAERNAIANMITNGESKITKLACCMEDGSVGMPCGACREYLMQLDVDSGNIEILMDVESMEIKRLEEFLPMWWGKGFWGKEQ
jgi:cytidine deaminase